MMPHIDICHCRFSLNIIHLFKLIYNPTETIIINSKSMEIMITNDKRMICSQINDQNYILNNIIKFHITVANIANTNKYQNYIYHLAWSKYQNYIWYILTTICTVKSVVCLLEILSSRVMLHYIGVFKDYIV